MNNYYKLNDNIYENTLLNIFYAIDNNQNIKALELIKLYFKKIKENFIIKNADYMKIYLKDDVGSYHPTDTFMINFLILCNNESLNQLFSFKLYHQNKIHLIVKDWGLSHHS